MKRPFGFLGGFDAPPSEEVSEYLNARSAKRTKEFFAGLRRDGKYLTAYWCPNCLNVLNHKEIDAALDNNKNCVLYWVEKKCCDNHKKEESYE